MVLKNYTSTSQQGEHRKICYNIFIFVEHKQIAYNVLVEKFS